MIRALKNNDGKIVKIKDDEGTRIAKTKGFDNRSTYVVYYSQGKNITYILEWYNREVYDIYTAYKESFTHMYCVDETHEQLFEEALEKAKPYKY